MFRPILHQIYTPKHEATTDILSPIFLDKPAYATHISSLGILISWTVVIFQQVPYQMRLSGVRCRVTATALMFVVMTSLTE